MCGVMSFREASSVLTERMTDAELREWEEWHGAAIDDLCWRRISMIKLQDGTETLETEEYIDCLREDIKELRKRVDVEREIADYWFKKYTELKR